MKNQVIQTEEIGKNVSIAEFVVIRQGAKIGDHVVIHPHVVIEKGVVIEDGAEIFPGTYIGKIPKGAGSTQRPISYETKVVVGKECAIGPNAVIYYDVEIGNNTLVGDGGSIREKVKIGHHCLIGRYVAINYETTIGNYTKIMDLTHITGKCRIGNHVFVGMLVSTANDNQVITRHYVDEQIHGPVILDNVTIGTGATILPGVTIGENALVGAQALVTKDVPAFKVVNGIPARIVRDLRDGVHGDPK